MPSAQVIDLNPHPRTETTPLEKTLSAFSQRTRENQLQKQESDALSQIYKEYQQDGQNLEKTLMDIQTRPGISPTTRVNTVNQLINFQKHNAELQKTTQKQMEDQRKQLEASEKKIKEMEANKRIISDLEKRRGLQEGALAAYENDPKMAEQVSRPPKEKGPLGGLGGTPLSEEEASAIETVIRENPDASPEDLEIAFNKSKIPIAPGRISNILESRRRAAEANQKNTIEEKKLNRKEELDFHRDTQKFDEELSKNLKNAKKQNDTIKTIEKAVASGNVTPSSWANIFKGFGEIGDKISKAVLNKDEAALMSSIPNLLEGWKEVFGVRLSDADLRVLQDKLPDIGKSPEANRAILKILKKYGEQNILRGDIAADIKKKNKGLRPLGYAEKIEERFDELTTPVRIINPDNGREIEIPAYKLSDALEAGAKMAPLKVGVIK